MSSSIESDPASVEAERKTAQIIAFPVRPKPAAMRVAEPQPQDRLARALESLNAALAEQRVALAAWRSALGELKATTTGLGDNLQTYQANLRSLGDSVSSLNAKARSLEQWADAAAAD
jgi:ABC-type transporter Mla subunit MlaD